MSILIDLHSRLSAELDQGTASRVIDIIREEYGGEEVYIPRRSPFLASAVRSAAGQMSIKAAARACGVSERYVYQTLHKLRAERAAG